MGRRRAVRGHETVPAGRTPGNPLGLYRLTPEKIRHKTKEETEGDILAAENERANRLRRVYEAIELVVTARKDGTLVLR